MINSFFNVSTPVFIFYIASPLILGIIIYIYMRLDQKIFELRYQKKLVRIEQKLDAALDPNNLF